VLTGEGKFFSNGFDLKRFEAEPEIAAPVVASSTRLFGRLLTFPAYTVAAITATPSPPEPCWPRAAT